MSEPVWVPIGAAADSGGPCARVFHNANQAIPNAVLTPVAFNSEDFDTDGIHDTATNNSRLTCRTAGKYVVGGDLQWAAGAIQVRVIGIRKNGLGNGIAQVYAYPQTAVDAFEQQVVSIVDLAVGDYVEMVSYQQTGGALNAQYGAGGGVGAICPVFWMARIGAIGPGISPAGTPPLVTALPGSATDGQEIILVDSLTAPTYSWHMRYVAAKASNKWLFVGGAPLSKFVAVNAIINTLPQVGASGSYHHAGTDFVTPVAGEWNVQGLFTMDPNGTGGWMSATVFAGSANTGVLGGSTAPFPAASAGQSMVLPIQQQFASVPAGTTIGIANSTTVPATHKVAAQSALYTPRALGG